MYKFELTYVSASTVECNFVVADDSASTFMYKFELADVSASTLKRNFVIADDSASTSMCKFELADVSASTLERNFVIAERLAAMKKLSEAVSQVVSGNRRKALALYRVHSAAPEGTVGVS